MSIANVDFGDKGPSKAYLRGNTGNETGFTTEIRLDSADGVLLGTLSRDSATSGGWSGGTDEVAAEAEITEAVTGVHTIYLVNKSGAMNFFGVHFDEKEEADVPAVTLNAYNADEMRVPWFGTGVEWLEGSGLGLLTLETEGMEISDGYCVTGITTGSVMSIANVDFGDKGPSKGYIRAGSTGYTMEVRLDSVDGTLLADVTGENNGWDGTAEISAEFEISEELTGVHKLYLINKTGGMNFFGIHFDEKASEPEPDEPFVPEIATSQIDAYLSGGILVNKVGATAGGNVISLFSGAGKDGGYVISDMSVGTVIKIAGVDFGSKQPLNVSLYGNSGATGGFGFELRMDGVKGPKIATLSRDNATSGGWSSGADQVAVTAELDVPVTGVHNLYLVLTGGAANFYGLSFSTTETEPDKPDEPFVPEIATSQIDAYLSGGILVNKVGATAGGNVISLFSGAGKDGGYVISDMSVGTVIKIAGVDFGSKQPLNVSLYGNSGATGGFGFELRMDGVKGPKIATLSRDNATSGGWSSGADQVAVTAELDVPVTGVHNLYLVLTDGAANFYGLSFSTTETGPSTEPEPPAVKPAVSRIDAYTSGGILVNKVGVGAGGKIISVVAGAGSNGSYVVSDTAPGTIIEVLGVDFGSTPAKEVNIRGNTGNFTGFTMELRLDSADGKTVAVLSRDSATSGGWSSGAESIAATAELTKALTGVHNLYLVLTSGSMNFYGIGFSSAVGGSTQLPPRKDTTSQVDGFRKEGLLVKDLGTGVGNNIMSVVYGNGSMGDYIVENVGPDTIIEILGVDFGTDAPKEATIMANTGAPEGFRAEIRLDGADGPVIGVLSRSGATDGGWSSGVTSVAATAAIDTEVTGVHNIYIYFTSGYCNFYGVTFYRTADESDRVPAVKDPVPKVDAYEDDICVYNVGVGAGGDVISVVAGNGTDGDYIISDTGPGTIIEILGVQFGDISPVRALLLGNTGHNEGFVIELRVDRADGEVLGVFSRSTPTDGGWSSGADQVASSFELTSKLTGVHNLYLVYVDGYANFYGVSFEAPAEEKEEVIKIPYVDPIADNDSNGTPGNGSMGFPVVAVAIGAAVIVAGGAAIAAVLVLRRRKPRGKQ